MALGPGKYDAACTKAQAETLGSVLLIVVRGIYGSGFSAQVEPDVMPHIVALLRKTADDIEGSIPKA